MAIRYTARSTVKGTRRRIAPDTARTLPGTNLVVNVCEAIRTNRHPHSALRAPPRADTLPSPGWNSNAGMNSLDTKVAKLRTHSSSPEAPFRTALNELGANELIFAVVGPVGSGTTEIAQTLKFLLDKGKYDTSILKARAVIESAVNDHALISAAQTDFLKSRALQDAGDNLRRESKDSAAIAVGLVQMIRKTRAEKQGSPKSSSDPVIPDGKKRAYILDSIRHPHEVALLRRVYQEAFCLVGVFCQEEERLRRLQKEKYTHASLEDIQAFMERDENAPEPYGQKVSDAFHLADFFVDNTANRLIERKEPNPDWNVSDQLARLVELLIRTSVVRPRPAETSMFHAYGARMQSSCLSRQVGAALVDTRGNIVATGTNEVPRVGGGVYGGLFSATPSGDPDPRHDHRCFFRNKFCTNTREQNAIVDELVTSLSQLEMAPDKSLLRERIRRSRIGQLLEFSRSVHAEMDALLSAGRSGVKTVGTHLFVTTFPCHSCARHIVAAGVEEVQYIEPYPKSLAIRLHGDAIVTDPREWKRFSDNDAKARGRPYVLFRAFIGVAPRLYRRAFLKDNDLKDKLTGDLITKPQHPSGHATSDTLKLSYAQVEAHLSTLVGQQD